MWWQQKDGVPDGNRTYIPQLLACLSLSLSLSLSHCLHIRHDDDDDNAFSVDLDAALVGGKAKFLFGNAM